MFTFISSRLSFLENTPVIPQMASETASRFAKVATVALAIFGTLAAAFFIYRYIKAQRIDAEDSPIPPHIAPKGSGPITDPVIDPYKKSPIVKPDPKKSPVKKKDSPISSPGKKPISSDPAKQPLPPKQLSDEELAKKLQEEESDAYAKQLQKELDDAAAKKKPKPVVADPFTFVKNPASPKPPAKPSEQTPKLPVATPKSPEKPKDVDDVKEPLDAPKAAPNPFTKIEDICGEISTKTFTDPSFCAVKAIAKIDPKLQKEVLGFVNEVIAKFEARFPISKKLAYGQQVPQYFANVKEQSDNDRKYLSLCGIRNLLHCGPSVLNDFRDTKYLGGEHHYAHMKGLKAFKYYTGNVVDLDSEFDATSDAQAIKEAQDRIVKFGKICGLTKIGGGELTAADVAKAMPSRKLDLPQGPFAVVHTAIDNYDRSNHGVWKRNHPTDYTKPPHYFANVPNTDLVVLATLRLPYILAELVYLTKEHKNGALLEEFYTKLFEKGISDMCFNDKSKTLVAFYHEWKGKLADNPADKARRYLKEKVFGEALSKQDPSLLIKNAQNQFSVQDLLEESEFGKKGGFDRKGRTKDVWMKAIEGEAIKVLQGHNLWENALFRAKDDDDEDYFLLNKGTLKVVLNGFYDYLYQ